MNGLEGVKIFRIGPGSVMKAMSRMSPPRLGHSSENPLPTRGIKLALAIREVSLMAGLSAQLKTIPEQPDNVRQSTRHKLRAIIATVIEKIEVETYKDGHFVLHRGRFTRRKVMPDGST